MNHCFLTLALFFCTLTLLPAQKLATLQVGRYTRQGTNVLVETGFLMAPKQGFVVNNSTTYPESAFAVHGMTSAVITAISGQTVALKLSVDGLKQQGPKGYLDYYSFSKKTYPAVGGDSYIVTLASGSSTSAPTLTLKASKTALKEGPKVTASFNIALDKAPTSDINVLFEFSGTAKGISDYVSSHNLGAIKIKKGQKTASVTITLRDDKLRESKEKLTFTVLPHGGYKLGKTKSASITISDND
ncbi:MAG: hypothetical protein EOP87_15285 [Verrucomicrobiaceae bacterium]|nr:MAG: hypothetical protein EOP87_15285 [Verrucomicrobiaceae bacterium]